MGDLTAGYTFASGETLTPAKLNNLVGLASLSAGAVSAAKLGADVAVYNPNYWVLKSAFYEAVPGDKILGDTSGGAFLINLPASPVLGCTVTLADVAYSWDVAALTIGRNGSSIHGLAEDLVCNVRGKVFMMNYNGTTWRVLT